MPEPTLIQIKTALAPDSIVARDRLRPVSEAGVLAILGSVEELGQIVTPLVVRQRRDKDNEGGFVYELLDGAHRLEVARRLGLETVPVRVFECTNDQARLLEIDGNLAGAELNPLDTAVFLATRKAVYERLHPETKRGMAGAAARWDANDMMSFASVTAEKFGMSVRHVERLVAAGSRLGPDEIAKLRAAPRQVTLKDLQDIAKIKVAPDRYGVVDALAEGRAKNAAAALKALQAPVEEDAKSPGDKQYLALKAAWDRAGMVARRRWIAEAFDDLSPLVVDEAEMRDGAEIADLRTRLERGEAA